MKRTIRRKDLERALEQVPRHAAPDPDLEQYRTPAPIAADLCWEAMRAGDLTGKRVLDLGCGTGMLSLGAALCGAEEVVGIDIDRQSLGTAEQAVTRTPHPGGVVFEEHDLREWHTEERFDTVLMNPPFGAQKANRRGDRLFYERAAEAVKGPAGGAVWFLAQTRSERFLAGFIAELGGSVEKALEWDYPIEAQFAFHDKPVRSIAVGGYCARF